MTRSSCALAGLTGLTLYTSPALAITRDEVLDRAQAWVDDDVPYSYSAWYTDPTSGECCYRSDCSGFVSAVWGIDPPGNTTYSFAGGPWDDGVSYEIDASDLLPGDALNYPGDPGDGTGHIMLYVSGDFWSGWVEVYEEYTHGEPATHRWRSIDPDIYLPIRYTGIEDCETETCDGADNDCDGAADEGWVCAEDDEAPEAAWRWDPAASSDIDGDGRADACARASSGLICALSSGADFSTLSALADLSDGDGFDAQDQYTTLRLADVTGDGMADACARSASLGFLCWPSQGTGFGAAAIGPLMTDANGWSDLTNYATMRMADIDGDGAADLCARADAGVDCWLSEGGAPSREITGPELSDDLGWSAERYWSTIRMGDIDGDGRADLCARASARLYCWLSDGAGFPTRVDGPALSDATGWDQEMYYSTLALPDLDGDGRADVCARGAAAVYCWLSEGTSFGGTITGPALSDDTGWSAHDQYATLRWADVTGDGRDDLCARGSDGFWCWPSNGSGFDAAFAGPELSDDLGWSDYPNYNTIVLGDIDGDGLADLCARADAGLYCWRSTGSGFSGPITGPAWSDALGWESARYFDTLRLAGGGPLASADSGDSGGTPDSAAPTDSASPGEGEGEGEGEDQPGPPGSLDKTGGCGCGGGPPLGALWLVGALALVGRRRR